MTFVVLFILAVVWAVYLFSWLRSRTERRSVNSISSFNRHLSVLERTSPARLGVSAFPGATATPVRRYAPAVAGAPTSLDAARRRRRDVLFALGGAGLVSLMLAVVVGGAFLYLFVLVLALLGGYVALLVRAQAHATERRNKVLYMPEAQADEYDHPYLLQQPASAH